MRSLIVVAAVLALAGSPAAAQSCADVRAADGATRAYYAAQMSRGQCLRIARVCRVNNSVCPR
jgi:hypothetical protein